MALDNYQPSLAVTQLVQTSGPYPGNAVNEGDFTMAMVRMFAGNFAWEGSMYATGQELALSQNTALFSLLGSNFGGDGSYTFGLPDLQGMASLGDGQGSGLAAYYIGQETGLPEIDLAASQVPSQWGGSNLPIDNVQPSLAIDYLIRVSGDAEDVGSNGTGDLLGGIVKYLGNAELRGAPPGYLIADGQLLDKDVYPDLFALIGFTYGGDNVQFFALPDLRGRIPVGGTESEVGTVLGAEQTTITQSQMPTEMGGGGQPVDNTAPSLMLRYIICVDPTVFPPHQGGAQTAGPADAYMGEIMLYAGTGALPTGWMLCDGATLSISGNSALFSILGTSYGGDGATNFKLPDFTGKTDIGWGSSTLGGFNLGQTYGADELTLTTADMPDLAFSGTSGDDTLLAGGDGNDTIDGLAGNDTIEGNGGDDLLIGGDGTDSIVGGDGNDDLDGGADSDSLFGGAGDDTLDGGSGADGLSYIATNGHGVIVNLSATAIDTALGQGPADIDASGVAALLAIYGQSSFAIGASQAWDDYGDIDTLNNFEAFTTTAEADFFVGRDAVNDVVALMAGDDWAYGLGGSDLIDGYDGDDHIYGGDGADFLNGLNGADYVSGGQGNDQFDYYASAETGDGAGHFDTIDGGDGTDTVFVFAPIFDLTGVTLTSVEQIKIGTNVTQLTLGQLTANVSVMTEASSPLPNGFELDASAVTGAGIWFKADGFNGNDTIRGGAGADTLESGAGADTLLGGGGDDTFVVSSVADFANDEIDGEGGFDTLRLAGGSYDFGGRVSGIETIVIAGDSSTELDLGTLVIGPGGLSVLSADPRTANTVIDASTAVSGIAQLHINGENWSGDDTIIGSAGEEKISAGLGSNSIDGGGGFDRLGYDWATFDIVVDVVAGTTTDAATNGADLSDTFAGIENFWLGDGHDSFVGSSNLEVISGFGGNDTIDAGGGYDEIVAGFGADVVIIDSADDLGDYVEMTAEAATTDTLRITTAGTYGFTGAQYYYVDVIELAGDQGAWNLTLDDDLVSTAQYGGTLGHLLIEASIPLTNSVTINGSAVAAGRSLIIDGSNFSGSDLLIGGAGDDTISGGAGSDSIVGGDGDDSLLGDDGYDTLQGGNGNDTLDGGAHDDELNGGAGADSLDGGAGDYDILSYDSPDGHGVIVNFSTASIDTALGQVPAGIDAAGIAALLAISGETEFSIGARQAWDGYGDIDTFTDFEIVAGSRFADFLIGSDAGEGLRGDDGDDWVYGLGGDDDLDGGDGDDQLFGGEGSDSLSGGDGADLISAGAGDDFITYNFGAGAGDGAGHFDTVDGGAGNDKIYVFYGALDLSGVTVIDVESFQIVNSTELTLGSVTSDGPVSVYTGHATTTGFTFDGSAVADADLWFKAANFNGDDTITGGAGDDTLESGAGADSLVGGDGNDTFVAATDIAFPGDIIDGGDGDDRLQLGSGTYAIGALLSNVETIELTAAANLTIEDGAYTGLSGVLRITTNGAVTGGVDINGSALTAGHSLLVEGADLSGDDALAGGGGNDTISAGLGTNHIDGEGGIDTADYSFTALDLTIDIDNHYVLATGLDDSIEDLEVFILGGGNDTVTGSAANETIDGGAGDDSIHGGAGDDVITGGGGTDTLIGGLGADTFILSSAADLVDTIDGTGEQGTEDVIELQTAGTYDFSSAPISSIDVVRLTGSSGDWTLKFTDAMVATAEESGSLGSLGIEAAGGVTGKITIDGSALTDGHAIVINPNTINTDTDVTAGAGSDTLRLGNGKDTVRGGGGMDYISGGGGADDVDAGSGDDFIYIHNAGELTDGTDYDTIAGGAGGDYLFLLAPGSYDLRNVSISGIEYLQWGGSILWLGDMPGSANGYVYVFGSSSAPVTIDASAAATTDYFFNGISFDGSDEITGGGGDDTFAAGNGADSLVGGEGDDLFRAGDATVFADDTIDGGDGLNRLAVGEGTFSLTTNRISNIDIVDVLDGAVSTIIVLGDAVAATSAYMGQAGLIGVTSTHNATGNVTVDASALTGSNAVRIEGARFIYSDTLKGGAGDDWFSAGEGQNVIQGGDGIDTLDYSFTVFELDIDAANGSTTDVTNGGTRISDSFTGIERFILGDGHDYFVGSAASETITGGVGNDYIDGGGGTADRVVYAGDWKDYTISESAGEIVIVANVGAEGADTIANVEFFEFAGGVVATASQVLNDAPVAYTTVAQVTEPTGTPGIISTTGVVITTDADTFLGDVTVVTTIRAGVESAGGATTAVDGQTTVSGTYGTLTIEEDGTYTYTLNGGAMSSVKGGETVHDHFTYTVGDIQGLSDSAEIYVTIYEANDAPSGTDKTINIVEDGAPYTVAVADFGWFDGDGNDLQSIIITSLPAAGTLTYFGTPVAAGTALDIYGISIGALVFTPAANGNGSPYGSFAFKVVDNGGTDSGGQNTDPVANTIRFNVAGVNDAPVITSNGGAALSVAVNENAVAVTTIVGSDVDSSLTWSLTGADAARFAISSTGVVTFRAAPDFEAPADAGGNNVYNVTVVASDGSLSDTQALTLTVRNIAGNTATGTAAANTINLTGKAPGGKSATNEEDRIDGKGGNDKLNGAGGNDTIIGGAGKDTLDGGAGADRFVFNAKLDAKTNVDTIKSFAHDLDLIQLDDKIFAKIGAELTAGEFYAKKGATTAHDRNDRIIYDTKTGKLYYDADGNKSGAAIHFATLTDKPVLDHGDFGIV